MPQEIREQEHIETWNNLETQTVSSLKFWAEYKMHADYLICFHNLHLSLFLKMFRNMQNM